MSKSFIILISSIAVVLAFVVVDSRAQQQEEPLLPEGCACVATDEMNPVCGNNGRTYPNLSTLKCADECLKYTIRPMHHGPCKT